MEQRRCQEFVEAVELARWDEAQREAGSVAGALRALRGRVENATRLLKELLRALTLPLRHVDFARELLLLQIEGLLPVLLLLGFQLFE